MAFVSTLFAQLGASGLLASAALDRWGKGFSSGFVKGAAIGVVVWLIVKAGRSGGG